MGDMIDWLNAAGTREERLKENGRRRERERKQVFRMVSGGKGEKKGYARKGNVNSVSLSLSLS